jgi:branched-chain amino acid transport system permease protein
LKHNIGPRSADVLLRSPWLGVAAIGLIALVVVSFGGALNIYLLNSVLLACMGAISLNVLMGTAGQVSIGNAAFMAVGAFSDVVYIHQGVPVVLSIALSGITAGLSGVIIGLPALRLRGMYLALATLAGHFIVLFFANQYQINTNNNGAFSVPLLFQSYGYNGSQKYWTLMLWIIVSVTILGAARLTRGGTGRALRLIRDHQAVAATLGVRVPYLKLVTFSLGATVIGVQGALTAHLLGTVSVDNFTIALAIQYVAMIMIGGFDSIAGAVIGAALVTSLPVYVPDLLSNFMSASSSANYGPQISEVIYGALIVLCVMSSPAGIVGWLRSARDSVVRRYGGRRSARALAPVTDGGPGRAAPAMTPSVQLWREAIPDGSRDHD